MSKRTTTTTTTLPLVLPLLLLLLLLAPLPLHAHDGDGDDLTCADLTQIVALSQGVFHNLEQYEADTNDSRTGADYHNYTRRVMIPIRVPALRASEPCKQTRQMHLTQYVDHEMQIRMFKNLILEAGRIKMEGYTWTARNNKTIGRKKWGREIPIEMIHLKHVAGCDMEWFRRSEGEYYATTIGKECMVDKFGQLYISHTDEVSMDGVTHKANAYSVTDDSFFFGSHTPYILSPKKNGNISSSAARHTGDTGTRGARATRSGSAGDHQHAAPRGDNRTVNTVNDRHRHTEALECTDLEELVGLFTGEFVNEEQNALDMARDTPWNEYHFWVRRYQVPVNVKSLDSSAMCEHTRQVYLVQCLNNKCVPRVHSILNFVLEGDHVRMETYGLGEHELNATKDWREDIAPFKDLSVEDVHYDEGCNMCWTKAGPGTFEGKRKRKQCSCRHGKTEVHLDSDGYHVSDTTHSHWSELSLDDISVMPGTHSPYIFTKVDDADIQSLSGESNCNSKC